MGLEFMGIFDEWADSYDDTVAGLDIQYKDVFENYSMILKRVVKHSSGTVLEFGVGTGNLSNELMQAELEVIGIEPSKAMRELAKEKLPNLTLLDGDFLSFPIPSQPIHTIVSTFAFHHLTDHEKNVAIKKYYELLEPRGKIVFGDTMFESLEAHQMMIEKAKGKGYDDLAEDLDREYYPTIPTMQEIFEQNNFNVSFEQMNDFAWLLVAEKM